MVVLETAMVPNEGAGQIAGVLNAQRGPEGFFTEAHPKLRPVETNTAGVYLAGVAQGPKDIPDTVAQAGAAASKVIGLLARGQIESNPMIVHVDNAKCSGCGACTDICPYGALELVEVTLRENSQKVTRTVAKPNPGLCQGCGACTVACRSGAADLLGFTMRESCAKWRRCSDERDHKRRELLARARRHRHNLETENLGILLQLVHLCWLRLGRTQSHGIPR